MRAGFRIACAATLLLTVTIGRGQTSEATLHSLLAERVEPAATSKFQMEQFLSHRIPAPAHA